MSNLPCRDILLQLLSDGFVVLPSSLVDGLCRYLCVQVSEWDLVMLGLIFRVSGYLFGGKALCITIVSFARGNDQPYLAIL